MNQRQVASHFRDIANPALLGVRGHRDLLGHLSGTQRAWYGMLVTPLLETNACGVLTEVVTLERADEEHDEPAEVGNDADDQQSARHG